jgi:hypothetical protein
MVDVVYGYFAGDLVIMQQKYFASNQEPIRKKKVGLRFAKNGDPLWWGCATDAQ